MVVAGEFSVVLPAVSSSISMMRHFIAHVLRLCEAGIDRETAALVLSELVTNALEHGQTQRLTVALRIEDERTTIAVTDESVSAPQVQPGGVLKDHGQGLRIVEHLVEDWGWSFRDPGHKVVWAVLSANATPAEGSRVG